MAGLQAAQRRLDTAVARLETALEAYSGRLQTHISKLESDTERAEEVNELVAALEAAQRDNERLSSANDTAVERIDRVVARLHGLLGVEAEAET